MYNDVMQYPTSQNDLGDQIREHIPVQKATIHIRVTNYGNSYLRIARMYQLAVADKGDSPEVKDWLYRKIFNEEFNIGFGYPHSDICKKCDLLKLAVDNAQT